MEQINRRRNVKQNSHFSRDFRCLFTSMRTGVGPDVERNSCSLFGHRNLQFFIDSPSTSTNLRAFSSHEGSQQLVTVPSSNLLSRAFTWATRGPFCSGKRSAASLPSYKLFIYFPGICCTLATCVGAFRG